jgi:tetratricopeptide (TPR) repeat protein
VTHFDASAKLKPESAASHFNLGTALTLAGRLTEAIGEYERALRITPDYAVAHNNLGDVFASQGKLDAAMDQYRESLRSDPTNAMTHNNLGNALLRRGNVSEALRHLSEALRINPAYADAHYNMGRMFQDDGEIREAIGHFQRAVQLEPDWAPALSALAWLLAVAPDASLRDAAEAGRLAERAADLTGRRDAAALDVLAAAYAASGLFDRAIQTAEAALRLTPSASLAREIQSRGELYKRRQPYVMTKQP